MSKDIEITCSVASVRAIRYSNEVNVLIEDVDVENVLKCFTPKEIAENIELDDVLQELTAEDIVVNFRDNASLFEFLRSRMNDDEILSFFTEEELQNQINERK